MHPQPAEIDGQQNLAPAGEDLVDKFTLHDGPLYRLECRLGLVRGVTNTIGVGLSLGALLWIVLIALGFIQGVNPHFFTLSAIGIHIRLLIVIPLFFVSESWLDPRLTAFVSMLARSGIVPDHALPTLRSEVGLTKKGMNSRVVEAICLLGAVLLSLGSKHLHLYGLTATFDLQRDTIEATMAGLWYWIVCLTVFRFLILRWLWRLMVWCYFLWRVSNLELDLIPIHPDGVGGLGYLEVVHMHFVPLILAISATQAGSLAEEIIAGRATFFAVYPVLALTLVVDAVLFLGPLFIFTPKLWACRVQGLVDYMVFAGKFVSDFRWKWLGAGASAPPLPLGSPDVQSLADLSNSVNLVQDMRLAPVSLRLLTAVLIAAILPILPLLLFQYPLAELIQKFFARLTGI